MCIFAHFLQCFSCHLGPFLWWKTVAHTCTSCTLYLHHEPLTSDPWPISTNTSSCGHRCCASCVSCACYTCTPTPSSSCQRCTRWRRCLTCTPSRCTATSSRRSRATGVASLPLWLVLVLGYIYKDFRLGSILQSLFLDWLDGIFEQHHYRLRQKCNNTIVTRKVTLSPWMCFFSLVKRDVSVIFWR